MGKKARERAARKAAAKPVGRRLEALKARLLVLWGYPGAGKSWYARWLHRENRYTHVDTDALRGTELDAGWYMTFTREMTPEAYMALVARHGRPVVVEFGLWANPDNIALLRRMRDAGAEPWFFYGDRAAAKAAWREENRTRPRDFEDGKWDEVVGLMDANWRLIVEAIGQERMLRTIEAGPERLAPEVIYRGMTAQVE
ncbi:MAG: AAA family ATPase [Candidatus Binatia bacterium]